MQNCAQFIVRIKFFNALALHASRIWDRFLIYHAAIMRIAASGILASFSRVADYNEEFLSRSTAAHRFAR